MVGKKCPSQDSFPYIFSGCCRYPYKGSCCSPFQIDLFKQAPVMGFSPALESASPGLTFYEDDTTSFLRPHCGQMSPLLMVADGEPPP